MKCFRASFCLFSYFYEEIKARVFMLAHCWTQSAPDRKAPTDFKGNRVMPMLRALENVKMKTTKKRTIN